MEKSLTKTYIGLMKHATSVIQVYEALLYALVTSTGASGAFLAEGLNLHHINIAVGSLRNMDPVKKNLYRTEPGELRERESMYLYTSRLAPWTIGLDGGDRPSIPFMESLIGTASTLCSVMRSIGPKKTGKDILTGLYNKEAFLKDLDSSLVSAARQLITLHLLFIDLNNFKAVNDTFGHVEGDKVLLSVSYKLWQILSGYGTLYRYGGDEFCSILAGVTFKKVQELKEQLEAEVVHKVGGIRVSCAIGMASYQEEMKAGDLIRQADFRMYDEKNRLKQLVLVGA